MKAALRQSAIPAQPAPSPFGTETCPPDRPETGHTLPIKPDHCAGADLPQRDPIAFNKGAWMADTCIFCQIANAELPAHKLFEDDLVIAFLDLHPIREGHALIIPRQHCPWFEDLPEFTAARIMAVGQRLARAMKREWEVERVSFFYTGIHVPHAHAHVVPRTHRGGETSAPHGHARAAHGCRCRKTKPARPPIPVSLPALAAARRPWFAPR